ncbi:MAG: hypothetical protein NTX50_09990 [Candidatus Sumerlaeota bacterium]|nr:hypothetical protein [Candidatus Sumerlaeota bacterium]
MRQRAAGFPYLEPKKRGDYNRLRAFVNPKARKTCIGSSGFSVAAIPKRANHGRFSECKPAIFPINSCRAHDNPARTLDFPHVVVLSIGACGGAI